MNTSELGRQGLIRGVGEASVLSAKDEVRGIEFVRTRTSSAKVKSVNPRERQKYSSRTVSRVSMLGTTSITEWLACRLSSFSREHCHNQSRSDKKR